MALSDHANRDELGRLLAAKRRDHARAELEISRLRTEAQGYREALEELDSRQSTQHCPDCERMAGEIERLRGVNRKLANKGIVKCCEECGGFLDYATGEAGPNWKPTCHECDLRTRLEKAIEPGSEEAKKVAKWLVGSMDRSLAKVAEIDEQDRIIARLRGEE